MKDVTVDVYIDGNHCMGNRQISDMLHDACVIIGGQIDLSKPYARNLYPDVKSGYGCILKYRQSYEDSAVKKRMDGDRAWMKRKLWSLMGHRRRMK